MRQLLFDLLTLTAIVLAAGDQGITQCATVGALERRALVQKHSLTTNFVPLRNGSSFGINTFLESEESVATNASSYLGQEGLSSSSTASAALVFFETYVKPQLRSIIQMMCLPLCICVIMICVSVMIDFMEENAVYFSNSLEGRVNSSFGSGNALDVMKSQNQRGAPLCPELVSPMKNECLIVVPSLAEIPPSQSTYDTSIFSKMGNPIVRITVARSAKLDRKGESRGLLGSSGGRVVERIEMSSWKRQKNLCYCELQCAEVSESSDAESSGRNSSDKHVRSNDEDSEQDKASVSSERSSSCRQFECSIYRNSGELFAVLEEALEPSPVGHQVFILSSANGSGWRLRIQGNVAQRSLTVIDEVGKQIVTVEPGGNLKFTTRDPTAKYFRVRAQPKVDAGVVLAALLAIDRLPGSHRVGSPLSSSIP